MQTKWIVILASVFVLGGAAYASEDDAIEVVEVVEDADQIDVDALMETASWAARTSDRLYGRGGTLYRKSGSGRAYRGSDGSTLRPIGSGHFLVDNRGRLVTRTGRFVNAPKSGVGKYY